MTRMEKDVVARSCEMFAKASAKAEKKARDRGDFVHAIQAQRDKNMAAGLAVTFRDILDEPCGSCKI